jgi:hypothetical protein
MAASVAIAVVARSLRIEVSPNLTVRRISSGMIEQPTITALVPNFFDFIFWNTGTVCDVIQPVLF